jgi:adenosylcobinamide-GDP ribazoletransferase
MMGLLTAVSFLTVVPVGAGGLPKEGQFGRTIVWFPLVGTLIGLALAGVDWCGRAAWDSYVAAALVIGAGILITGGLHLDGIMDTADAVFSRRDRAGMLVVMRDSRVGALGVAAGASVLLAKFAAYGHLAGPEHWHVIAAAPAMGRLSIAVAVAVFPYARADGTGARFVAETRVRHIVGALLIASAIGVGLFGPTGAALAPAVLVVSLAMGWEARRRLGGLTGDVYGAMNEMVELATLLGMGALIPR